MGTTRLPAKLAWVTGAGKGIGRALALRLAREGLTVVASARSAEDLESLAGATADASRRIVAWPLDVTDETAVAGAVEQIEAIHGPIDLAVLNAGTHQPVSATDFRTEAIRTLVEVNLMGVVHGIATLMPRMIARRAGRIAVMSSVAGYRGLPTASGYGATKAALINMCEALKPELDPHGVGITVICPGFVRTPLTDRNEFKMPFLIETEEAADAIFAGLVRGRFEIAFPRRFTMLMKLLRCLPYPLFFRLTRRMTGNDGA